MSYCVNCGVELDKTCSACPLCGTIVINPNQPVDTQSPKPYPSVRGIEEPVKRHEFTILMTIVFSTIALVCFLLNLFILQRSHWSFYVIGVCAMLWIFLLPVFFPDKIKFAVSLILNGISIIIFMAMIAWLHPGNGWYLDIAVPITVIVTVLIINFYYVTIRPKSSYIRKATTLLGSLAVICVCIELLVDHHLQQPLFLTWSAVVLICCVALDVILITISLLKGLREELRKRMHF